MEWLLLVLLALSPGIFYVLAVLGYGWKNRHYPERCPRCGERGLETVNFILATVVVDGQRAPDSWYYAQCRRCTARLKQHRGEWQGADHAEWEAHCGGDERVNRRPGCLADRGMS